MNLKSATKLFSVLLASKRPLITELADKLNRDDDVDRSPFYSNPFGRDG